MLYLNCRRIGIEKASLLFALPHKKSKCAKPRIQKIYLYFVKPGYRNPIQERLPGFSFYGPPKKLTMEKKSQSLIICFKKYLRNGCGQNIVEYSLLMVVIAGLLVALFQNNFAPIRNMFETPVIDMINKMANDSEYR